MKKLLYLLLPLIGLACSAFSQNVSSTYVFSNPATVAYANIAGTTVHAASVDDAISTSVPIGFTFQYGCSNVTNMKISSNGWLTFNTALSSSYATNDLDNATNAITNPLIVAPLWDDNQVFTGGAVRYQLTGVTPNQIMKIEWSKMEWDYFASGDVMSFQVWLYETINVIEFRYKRGATGVSAGGASIGLMGATTGDFISINTTPAASTAAETSNITTKPVDNSVYRFTPNTCSGVPAAGTAAASPSLNCSNFTTTLTLTGGATGCGLTYLWYEANAVGGPFTAIGTATTTPTNTFAVVSGTPKFFRCVTTCGASSATTAVITASVGTAGAGTGSYSVSLPYSISGQTTCGFLNDITSSNVTNVCGSTSYYTGEDVVYIFTPTVTAAYNASVTSTGSYVGMMLYEGCPTGTGVCVANSQSSTGNQSITGCATAVSAGTTYYLIIDSYASPTCNPYNLNMSLNVCSGPPTPGTAAASPSVNCGPYTTTLYLTGNSASCGITYQWYHSDAAAGTYTAIGTASSTSTQTFAVSTIEYFKCVVICGASSATTAVITATINPAYAGTGTFSVSLPYSIAGQTTCGSVNDITSSNVTNVCGSTSYYTGEDVVYVFTPTVTAAFNGSVTSSGSYMGMMLYEGCPTGTGVCVANAQSSTGNQSITSCSNMLTAGTTYYLVLDSYATPTCNPYSLNISQSLCSGTPTSGTAVASPSVNCGPFTTTLSLTGNSTTCGITYQWYYSNAAAGTYTAIGSSAFTTTQTFVVSSATYFKCVVTCGASSATTAVISTSINPTPGGTGTFSVSLPYTSGAQTTCGKVNDFTSSNVTSICGSSSYYTGEDVIYVFTPTVTGTFNGTVTSSGTYVGMMLYDGCPTAISSCLANSQSSSGTQSITTSGACASATLNAGQTYYLIIDSYAAPACNPYNLTMSLTAIASSTAAPCNMAYTPASTTFSFESIAGTVLPTTDDVLFSTYISFGFPICFDGKPYTGGYVASNSAFVFDAVPCFPNISSSTYAAGGVSTGYTITGAAPINGTSVPRNAILAPWHDINPGSSAVVASSKIQYLISGTSPNRKVVISWEDIPMFSGSCEGIAASRASSQIKLYEFDSSIEIHIKNKQVCASWNGGDAIMGLQNYNGTIYIPPVAGDYVNYNYPTNWTMTNTAYKFTNMCNGSGASCLTILPIGFMEFNGDKIDNVNTLYWKTSDEENINYFIVERSTDAINFTDIAKVSANHTPSAYTYKDAESVPGMINYYRIRAVEKSEKTSHTNIISIGASYDEVLSSWPIFPNPANTAEVFIRLNSKKAGTANFIIYDLLGNIVLNSERTIETGVKVYDLNISNLSLGVYFVEIKNSFNEIIAKQKLIIEK